MPCSFLFIKIPPLFRNLPFRSVKSDFARAGTLQIQAAHGRQHRVSALPQQGA
ncbi:TPA: hypothetical protein ACFRHF_000466 [Neisseria lactamica]